MKKYISMILIITVLVNVLFPVNSLSSGYQSASDIDSEIDPQGISSGLEIGSVKVGDGSESKALKEIKNLGSLIVVILTGVFYIPVIVIRTLMSLLTNEGSLADFNWFYISDLLFGDIELFNINFFSDNGSATNNAIKTQVTRWYYILRTIAIMLNLVILIYIGIRMAISTVASEKAEYKKKLIAWFESVIIIFFLHYFIAALMFLAEELLKIIAVQRGANLEEKIFNQLGEEMLQLDGWGVVATFISYCVLVYYQVKFMLMYFKRLVVTAFLVLISPFISITFAIDKVGDGKAQGFAMWRRELIINIFIQPLHAFLYLLFLMTASEVITQVPIMAAVFLFGISRGEKVIKNMFNFRAAHTLNSMKKDKQS